MGRGDSRRPSYGVEGVNPRCQRAVVADAPQNRRFGGDIAEGDPKGAQACATIQPAGSIREGLLLKDMITVSRRQHEKSAYAAISR